MPRQDAAPPLSGTRWAAPMQLGVVAWGGGSGVWWCPRVAHAFFGGGMGVVGFFLREESAVFCFYCLSLSRCACAMLGAATPTRPGAALPIPLLVVWSPRCRPPLTPTAAIAEAAWLSRAAVSSSHTPGRAPLGPPAATRRLLTGGGSSGGGWQRRRQRRRRWLQQRRRPGQRGEGRRRRRMWRWGHGPPSAISRKGGRGRGGSPPPDRRGKGRAAAAVPCLAGGTQGGVGGPVARLPALSAP